MSGSHSDGLKVASRIFWASLTVSIVGNAVGGYFGPSELDPLVTAGVHGLVPLFLAGAELRWPVSVSTWLGRSQRLLI